MERFVIGAAIFAAVVIAAGGYFGHAVSDSDGFRFEINADEDGGGGQGTGAPTAAAAQSYPGTELKIRNAVALVKIIPEDRTDISVEVSNSGRLVMPTVKVEGAEVIIDGAIASRRIHDCHGSGQAMSVDVRGIGEVTGAQAPMITARVPRAVVLSTGGAVEGEVGPSASAAFEFSGCGDMTIGDVAGPLKVNSNGTGATKVGASQTAELSSAGSGDIEAGAVAGKLEVALAGSGGATIASGGGPLDISIAGSGDVAINGGAMQDADISIAGSGDVEIQGSVQTLEVSIAGSGDVNVAGTAASVDASIMGSGDVNVGAVSGGVEKSIMGSGAVVVGTQAGFQKTAASGVSRTETTTRDYGDCLNRVRSLSAQYGAPHNVVESSTGHKEDFTTSDGSVSASCSRTVRKLVVERSASGHASTPVPAPASAPTPGPKAPAQ